MGFYFDFFVFFAIFFLIFYICQPFFGAVDPHAGQRMCPTGASSRASRHVDHVFLYDHNHGRDVKAGALQEIR